MDAFFAANSYVKGSYSEKEAFEGLDAALLKLEEGHNSGNRLFYLSLPPSVFATVTSNIKECCMSKTYVHTSHMNICCAQLYGTAKSTCNTSH